MENVNATGTRFTYDSGVLEDGAYVWEPYSTVLPPLTSEAIGSLLAGSAGMERPAWMRKVRAWVREHS